MANLTSLPETEVGITSGPLIFEEEDHKLSSDRDDHSTQEYAPVYPGTKSDSQKEGLTYYGEKLATPIIEEIGCESRTDDREELITIIVEIGDGREETIIVYTGDNAGDLAETFATKHNLSETMKAKLRENIQLNMNQILEELEEAGEAKTLEIKKEMESLRLEGEIKECEEEREDSENVEDDEQEAEKNEDINNIAFMGKRMSERSLTKPIKEEGLGKEGDQETAEENGENGEKGENEENNQQETERNVKVAPDLNPYLKKMAADILGQEMRL